MNLRLFTFARTPSRSASDLALHGQAITRRRIREKAREMREQMGLKPDPRLSA